VDGVLEIVGVRRHHRVGVALIAPARFWSGSISQVKSHPSFMQMAGETESKRTAAINSSALAYPSISTSLASFRRPMIRAAEREREALIGL
jgi:hypothetical protein